MPLTPGTHLGTYVIIAPFAGRMGEVYRARDSRLGRDVTIRVLPTLTATDERMRRFEQEARVTGMLNHPNLLTIYDVGSTEGALYLVSELLEGETLRDRLKRGPIFPRKAVDIALEVAHGLAAAHAKGIVHRDLKPENVYITRDGRIKILDFGIAEFLPSEPTAGPAFQVPATEPGIILGSIGYMSPEQVHGEEVDHRSDVFALGAILYEMLTGAQAFKGRSAIETLGAILHDEPEDMAALNPDIPTELVWLVRDCLAKDREKRIQSANEVAFTLDEISKHFDAPKVRERHRLRVRWSMPVRVVRSVANGVGRAVSKVADLLPLASSLASRPAKWFARRPVTESKETKGARSAGERIVNSGFAVRSTPDTPIAVNRRLGVGRRYWFWLEVGEPISGSIEVRHVPLPTQHLPPRARLTVALFAFPNGLRLDASADTGTIELQPDGSAKAIRQPGPLTHLRGDSATFKRRLLFPLRTRLRTGKQQLRCNIYYGQVLVQSRVVSAEVSLVARRSKNRALGAAVDYTLSRSLDPVRLQKIPEHRLSVMLNDGANAATHQLRFFGIGLKADLSISGHVLATSIDELRGTLRMAAWNSRDEWNGNINAYRYMSPTHEMLRGDLARMASAGYRFFSLVLRPCLSRAVTPPTTIDEIMRTPGLVQIASRRDLRESVPAALVYDYPLDTTSTDRLTLCPEFLRVLDGGGDLERTDCFKGHCPSYGHLAIVCPSGFWGFRHMIGIPLSPVAEPDDDDSDAPGDLGCVTAPRLAVAVSTDRQFLLRIQHEQQLHKLQLGGWDYAQSRGDALNLLQQAGHHIVYFYCHGGMSGPIPYILLGPPDSTGITPDNLVAFNVKWKPPGPLVFINGCHTTALSPWSAFNFVSSFIESAASAVIGTDITVFEPLACIFAEEFFQAFVVDRLALGAAVRRARLKLLSKMNPLGLVYLPFALASLTLTKKTEATVSG